MAAEFIGGGASTSGTVNKSSSLDSTKIKNKKKKNYMIKSGN